MNWFRPSSEVKSPNELFGWNEPNGRLDGLVKIIVNGRSHVQIIGERRSGKSSILNCISYKIKKDISKNKLIPVIVNFNNYYDENLNEQNGYNLFSACVLNELGKIDELKPNDKIKIENVKINKENDVGGYLDNLSKLSKQKTKSFFKNLIIDIAKKEYSILLLIDEYEGMFTNIFQGKDSELYGIRSLITSAELPNDQVFQCCITGTRDWSYFYNSFGSEVWNFINDTLYIPTLDLQTTKELILHGFSESKKEIEEQEIKKIFSLSGGSPFYIKTICNSLIVNGLLDENDLSKKLFSHFNATWQRLNNKERLLLKGETGSRSEIKHLQDLNLLDESGERPNGDLWFYFIVEAESADEMENIRFNENFDANIKSMQLRELANFSNDTLFNINDVLSGKGLDVIFHLNQSPSYFKYADRLGTPCCEKDQFKEFITGLYMIIFESTQRHFIKCPNNFSKLESVIEELNNARDEIHIFKHWSMNNFIFRQDINDPIQVIYEIDKLCKVEGFKTSFTKYAQTMVALPPQFNKYPKEDLCPDIFYIIDILRHKWADGHDTRSPNFVVRKYTPQEAQEKLLGHRNIPSNEEWLTLQMGILKDLNQILGSILNWANEQ